MVVSVSSADLKPLSPRTGTAPPCCQMKTEKVDKHFPKAYFRRKAGAAIVPGLVAGHGQDCGELLAVAVSDREHANARSRSAQRKTQPLKEKGV